MHATRRTPVDDPDLEDIVVYADEDSRNGRIAQVFKSTNFDRSPVC